MSVIFIKILPWIAAGMGFLFYIISSGHLLGEQYNNKKWPKRFLGALTSFLFLLSLLSFLGVDEESEDGGSEHEVIKAEVITPKDLEALDDKLDASLDASKASISQALSHQQKEVVSRLEKIEESLKKEHSSEVALPPSTEKQSLLLPVDNSDPLVKVLLSNKWCLLGGKLARFKPTRMFSYLSENEFIYTYDSLFEEYVLRTSGAVLPEQKPRKVKIEKKSEKNQLHVFFEGTDYFDVYQLGDNPNKLRVASIPIGEKQGRSEFWSACGKCIVKGIILFCEGDETYEQNLTSKPHYSHPVDRAMDYMRGSQ